MIDALGRYPGRGVLVHADESGAIGWVYLVTGRSPESRHRRVRRDGDRLVIESVPLLVAVYQSRGDVRRVITAVVVTPGEAAILTTYSGHVDEPNGSAPRWTFVVPGSIRDVAHQVWASLDPGRRVLVVAGHGSAIGPVELLP